MKKNKQKIQQLTLAAFFVAIEVLMGFTPIGFIPVGALSITTMHLPVILSGILMGPLYGGLMGFIFGFISFCKATFSPGITSFVFTPFVTVGGIQGNFWSLVIVFVPRILLGVLSGLMYSKLSNKVKNKHLLIAIVAIINTMIHSCLVLGGIYLFFAQPYAQALGKSVGAIAALMGMTICTNSILEALLAGIVIPVLVKALTPSAKRTGILYGAKQ